MAGIHESLGSIQTLGSFHSHWCLPSALDGFQLPLESPVVTQNTLCAHSCPWLPLTVVPSPLPCHQCSTKSQIIPRVYFKKFLSKELYLGLQEAGRSPLILSGTNHFIPQPHGVGNRLIISDNPRTFVNVFRSENCGSLLTNRSFCEPGCAVSPGRILRP